MHHTSHICMLFTMRVCLWASNNPNCTHHSSHCIKAKQLHHSSTWRKLINNWRSTRWSILHEMIKKANITIYIEWFSRFVYQPSFLLWWTCAGPVDLQLSHELFLSHFQPMIAADFWWQASKSTLEDNMKDLYLWFRSSKDTSAPWKAQNFYWEPHQKCKWARQPSAHEVATVHEVLFASIHGVYKCCILQLHQSPEVAALNRTIPSWAAFNKHLCNGSWILQCRSCIQVHVP